MTKVSLLATRTQLLGMTACGLIGGLVIFMAGVGVGMHPTETNGRLISEPIAQAPIAAPVTQYLPQAMKTITVKVPGATITKVAPRKELTCAGGATEDSCYPDYIGKGRWVLKAGERPAPQVKSMPKATKKVAQGKKVNKVPGATIAGVCMHPSITKDMVADCNKLASRPAETKAGYSNPKGSVLVQECTEQYKGEELATCLR